MSHYIASHPKNMQVSVTGSIAVRQILHQAHTANPTVPTQDLVVFLGVQWSDAFDPNSSIQANRGAVWIKTLTFVSETFHQNRIDHTYPIGIGLKMTAMIVLNPNL